MMLLQLQVRAPFKGMQLMRSIAYNSKQLQAYTSVKPAANANEAPPRSSLAQKFGFTKSIYPSVGYSTSSVGMPQVIHEQLRSVRQYSVCPNLLDQLQAAQATSSSSSSSPGNGNGNGSNSSITSSSAIGSSSSTISSSSSSNGRYADLGIAQSKNMALVPIEKAHLDLNNAKVAGTPMKSQSQPKMPEQIGRKIPYYNPLRRRSNVDPARVQYIKDRFKERKLDSDTKPQVKKYISRTTLHSGRLDKIN